MLADPGPIRTDLELGRLCIKDLRSLCSRLNLTTTGGRAALIKRIEEARKTQETFRALCPLSHNGGERIKNFAGRMNTVAYFVVFRILT